MHAGSPYVERDNPQVVNRRSRAKAGIIRDGAEVEMRALPVTNVPQFCAGGGGRREGGEKWEGSASTHSGQ